MIMETDEIAKKTKWSIDLPHSEIAFKIRHLMITNVRGSFKVFDASIYTEGKDFSTAEIDLWIDASSITTGDAKRDEHLKSTDFFDAASHKQITFTSSSVGKSDLAGNHELWGELTMRGITKTIELEVQFGGRVNDPWGKERAGFAVTGKINRKDWGLDWNTIIETGGLMVSEEVFIICELELINQGQTDLVMELEPAVVAAINS
jgi:polyisoprenoid-binding protein YceI